MGPTAAIEGVDPFGRYDAEAERLDRFFAGLPDDDPVWSSPSACAGWTVRDVLAHLLAAEEYNRATLEGRVASLLGHYGALGVTDVDSFNEVTIRQLDGVAPSELRRRWRDECAATCQGLRARGDGQIDTTVGEYPARLQAFHLAVELAVHAGDVGVPLEESEARGRQAWLVAASRFLLAESHDDLVVVAVEGGTRVAGRGVDAVLDDATFVAAVTGRLADDAPIDDAVRAVVAPG